MIERTATIPLMFQPGTDWSYSSAVDIQGYIVEKLTGKPFGQFLQENVFGPLKMKDTGFYTGDAKASRLAAVSVTEVVNKRPTGKIVEAKELFGSDMPDYSKPPAMESGGGGLVSTTIDYARFCQMMLNGGELDDVRVLSPASIELMDTNIIEERAAEHQRLDRHPLQRGGGLRPRLPDRQGTGGRIAGGQEHHELGRRGRQRGSGSTRPTTCCSSA